MLPLLIQLRPISTPQLIPIVPTHLPRPLPIELTTNLPPIQLILVQLQLHPIHNPLLVPIFLLPILSIAIPQQHTLPLLLLNIPANQFPLSFPQNIGYGFYHQQFMSKEAAHI